MERRILAVALVVAALALVRPAPVEANRFKPIYPLRVGILLEDSTCPPATHVLLDPCPGHARQTYLVFNRMKGIKRFLGDIVNVNGPIESSVCGLPLLDVRKIDFAANVPGPCQDPVPLRPEDEADGRGRLR